MYSPAVTQRAIEAANAAQGWDLQYHTLAQIEAAIAHFDDLLHPDTGVPTRPLTAEESRFISNERRLCALDYRYWSGHYHWIVDKNQKPVRFQRNIAQGMLLDIWSEFEEQARAIHVQNLKARRLGVSTETEAATQHRFQFHPYSNCVVASSDPDKSVQMAKMIDFSLSKQPWWLLPTVTKQSKNMAAEFGDIHTSLTIQAGNQFTGVARGATPSVVHLCAAPQTLVRTAHGILKPIIAVEAGDIVVTHTGKLARVKAQWKSPRRNELASEVWLWGNFAPLTVTRDHKVWCADGWREAGSLKDGDFVRYPVRPITHRLKTFSTSKHTAGGFPKVRKTHHTSRPLNRDWGWLCGLFLAEGTIQKNRRMTWGGQRESVVSSVVFAGDLSEVEWRSDRLKRAVGDDKHIGVQRSNSRTRILQVADTGIARWLQEEFGETDSKRVPDWVWDAGRDFALGVVEGYLHGDGHYAARNNEIYASSIRVQLPVQIRDLIASLGFGWSSIQYKSAGVYYERNCRAQWTLIVAGPTAKALRSELGKPVTGASSKTQGQKPHWRYTKDDASTWVEIEVEQVADAFSSEFYDLEVDDSDHSFTTVQCAISNSELASWVDAESLVDASLYRAIIDHPDVFCILESTAEGRGNWWHRTWEQNKKDWDRGRGRVRPVFLPWYVGTDLYPSATDLRARPIPPDWTPSDRVIRHAERARQYVLANPLLFQYLAKGNRDWTLPREQMWFHEIEYETALAKKELNLFLSELPADDIEAFQSEAISVVDQEVILNYRERVREPWGVFTILGRDIPQSLTVSRRHWDLNKPPITVRTAGLLRINETFTLQPLLWDGFGASPDPAFKLFVWEPPQDDVVYGQGVDTGDGLGEDGSVIEMLRKGTPTTYPAQVAEFASPYIKAFQLWPMSLAVACWYSTFQTKVGKRVQIRSAIECRTNGEAVQHEMQKRGWWNFHPWKRYDNRRPIADGKVHKLGVFTNEWFRSQMMDYILTLLDEESLEVYSPWFVDEMASIERDPDEQKAQAAYGEHDDRFMALGFILFSLYVDDIQRTRGVQRPPPPVFAHPSEDGSVDRTVPYATYQPSIQSLDLSNRLALPVVRGRRGPSSLGALRRPHSGRGW